MARKEQHDEVDEMEEGDVEEDGAELEAEADDESPAAAASSGGSSGGGREEDADERTVASRDHLRQELSRDVEAFLARGGKINYIEPNVVADPPRKPEGDYGSRPL